MTPYYQDDHVTLYHGRWQDVLAAGVLTMVDAVITDPPFGSRTHKGQKVRTKDPRYTKDGRPTLAQKGLGYTSWGDAEVKELVDILSPACRGWFAALTSHDLVPVYDEHLHEAGRYVFAPIACVQMYRSVRMVGDGPSNWTDRLVVARPTALSKWGALPGAYVGKPFDDGENMLDRSRRVNGGKPLWLMRDIVSDYSREGDLILDPCAGRGTTGRAAKDTGRRAILIEQDEATCEMAAAYLRPHRAWQQDLFTAEGK